MIPTVKQQIFVPGSDSKAIVIGLRNQPDGSVKFQVEWFNSNGGTMGKSWFFNHQEGTEWFTSKEMADAWFKKTH